MHDDNVDHSVDDGAYAQGVLHAWCGEVRGEESFRRMAEQEPDPMARGIWALVAEVEALTRQRIEPIAQRLHSDLEAAGAQAAREGEARAAQRRAQSWQSIVEDYAPQLDGFLARFEALETLAPAADRDAIMQLSDHSRAFGDCIRSLLAGESEAAAAHLQAYLDRYRSEVR